MGLGPGRLHTDCTYFVFHLAVKMWSCKHFSCCCVCSLPRPVGYLATGVEDGSVAFEFVSPDADGSEWQNTNPLVAQAPALAQDFKPSGVAAVKPFQMGGWTALVLCLYRLAGLELCTSAWVVCVAKYQHFKPFSKNPKCPSSCLMLSLKSAEQRCLQYFCEPATVHATVLSLPFLFLFPSPMEFVFLLIRV